MFCKSDKETNKYLLIILMSMEISNYIKDSLIKVKVIPNAKTTYLIEENGGLKLYLKSLPQKNKANLELIKFFKKTLNLKVEIKSGLKSREKVIKLL